MKNIMDEEEKSGIDIEICDPYGYGKFRDIRKGSRSKSKKSAT